MPYYDLTPKHDAYEGFPGIKKEIKKGNLKRPAGTGTPPDEISEETLNSIPNKDEISLE